MKLFKIKQPTKTTDFSIFDLPKNRKEQFFDILKNEWRVFLLLGFIFLLFAVPFFVVLVIRSSLLSSIASQYLLDVQNGILTVDEASIQSSRASFGLSTIFVFIECVCFLLLSIPIMGTAKVFKVLAYGEGLLFWSDFLKGIKENFSRFFSLTLINLCFFFLADFAYQYLIFSGNNSVIITAIVGCGFGIFLLFVFPVYCYSLAQHNFYNVTFIQNIKNGLKFAVRNFFWGMLLVLPLVGVFFVFGINNILIVLIIVAVLLFAFLPAYICVWHLFALSKFDNIINKEKFPDYFKKGLGKNNK